jgi:hypothetical protein
LHGDTENHARERNRYIAKEKLDANEAYTCLQSKAV